MLTGATDSSTVRHQWPLVLIKEWSDLSCVLLNGTCALVCSTHDGGAAAAADSPSNTKAAASCVTLQ